MNFIHAAGMSHLPPFDALLAFEATVRLRNMTAAAAEIGVTQSAISHRIRRLEDFFGVPLLIRRSDGLTPTPSGQAVFDGFGDVLKSVASLKARCRSAEAPDRLRVGVGSALAHYWLVRRLPDFAAQHPHICIELAIVENEAPERAAGVDIRILWVGASDARSTSTQRPLFREHVFPVCAPALLPKRFVPGDLSVFLKLPLLHKQTPGPQGAEWSWDAWFERLGLAARPRQTLRFTSIGPAIAAALDGAGVALARSMLVRDALDEGRLTRLLPPEFDQLSGKVHVVRWPGRLAGDSRVAAFSNWLVAAANSAAMEPVTNSAAAKGKAVRPVPA